MMNEEVKKLWCAALRSGEYAQGRGQLKGPTGYCCLGVLEKLAVDAGKTVRFGEDSPYYPSVTTLTWAGLTKRNPLVAHGGQGVFLGDLNDGEVGGRNSKSFAVIADLIENQL